MVIFLIFLEGEINDILVAHLRHGIKRIVIFDIDLHHGRPPNLVFSYLLNLNSRQWNSIDYLANQ